MEPRDRGLSKCLCLGVVYSVMSTSSEYRGGILQLKEGKPGTRVQPSETVFT